MRVEQSCPCGHVLRCDIGHYQRVQCKCGVIYWALQPTRHSPFVLFKWPGTAAMQRYKQQQALEAIYKIYRDAGLADVV